MPFLIVISTLFALPAFLYADPCLPDSPCHPLLGNLLIGRIANLSASSTCGSRGMERYCIKDKSTAKTKCLFCQSTGVYQGDRWKHHDVDVLDPTGNTTANSSIWWMSQPGVDNVTLTIDLEDLFEVHGIIIRYPFAVLEDITVELFDKRLSNRRVHLSLFGKKEHEEWSSLVKLRGEGTIRYYPFSLADQVIKVVINFNGFPNQTSNRTVEQFHAISELIVVGRCFCYGHSNQCVPSNQSRTYPKNMVHSKCMCTHNTYGDHCDNCLAMFNDHPWKEDVSCRPCNCSHYANSCTFDSVAFDYSGQISGGICQDCNHGRTGKNCEKCLPFHYKKFDESNDRFTCLPCDCWMKGSHNNSCDLKTGQCPCKEGFSGRTCTLLTPSMVNQMMSTERPWIAKGTIDTGVPGQELAFEMKFKSLRKLLRATQNY